MISRNTILKMVAIISLLALLFVANSQTGSTVTRPEYESSLFSEPDNGPYNGMGRIVLTKNKSDNNSRPILSQEDFKYTNTVYVFKYDFNLANDIILPDGCVLQFEGGSISGKHTIKGTNTSINSPLVKILSDEIKIAGTWNVPVSYPEWFGAKGDGKADDSDAIQKAFCLNCPVYLQCKVYGVSKPIKLVEATTISSSVSEHNVNPHAVSNSTPNYTAPRGSVKALKRIDGVFYIDGISVTIRNLAIDGNNKLAQSGIGQERTKYKSRVIIDNCYIYNCKYGMSTNLYLSEITNNTCHHCDVGFHNESGTGASMTSLTVTRNYAKNCSIGYNFTGLLYSNMSNNACDRCQDGVRLSRVRCCNFLANGFEDVKNVYTLTDYCEALEFDGVVGGALREGARLFYTDSSFYGEFSVKNVKLLFLPKFDSMIYITGNKEDTKYCIVHIDRSVNKFLCKGWGKYKIVEYEKNLIDKVSLKVYSGNNESLTHSGKTHVYKIGNGAHFIEGFNTLKGSRSKLIFELAEITLEPGEYLFSGFVISDQDIQEGVSCVISTGQFTNNTLASTRHNTGFFNLEEKTTIHMSLYLNKTSTVPSMIIAPYICKVN